MPRVKRGTKRRRKREKILDRASRLFPPQNPSCYRSARVPSRTRLKFAYSGRKRRKRQFRSLWIVRIGTARQAERMGTTQFIHGLNWRG